MRSFLVALAFLTVVPVRFRKLPPPEAVAGSRWWYPAVGVLLGAVLGGWAAVVGAWLRSPALSAFFILLAWVGVTGALHLDGFCDCCDGLFGGRTPEDRLRIMKDPHVGSFGMAGGVLLLLGKYAGLQAVLAAGQAPWVVGVAVFVARCLVLYVAALRRYPRPDGTGKVLIEATHRFEAVLFMAFATVVAVAVPGLAGSPGWRDWDHLDWLLTLEVFAAAVVAVLVVRRQCRRRLGGVTGDCLGAAIELAEAAYLLAAAVRWTTTR